MLYSLASISGFLPFLSSKHPMPNPDRRNQGQLKSNYNLFSKCKTYCNMMELSSEPNPSCVENNKQTKKPQANNNKITRHKQIYCFEVELQSYCEARRSMGISDLCFAFLSSFPFLPLFHLFLFHSPFSPFFFPCILSPLPFPFVFPSPSPLLLFLLPSLPSLPSPLSPPLSSQFPPFLYLPFFSPLLLPFLLLNKTVLSVQ